MNSLQSMLAGGVVLGSLAAVSFSTLLSTTALAAEPFKSTERPVLHEPAEITTVIDAFDEGDPIDVNITLGFQHTWRFGKILRESFLNEGNLTTGGYTADTMNVAKHSGSTSKLNTRLDVGVYKDLALYLRLPIILSKTSKLEGLDNSQNNQKLILQGIGDEQLFSLPFESPKRSGLEYLAVGLDANIMNQTRDPSKPTWLVGVEGRFSVSEPMHACGRTTGLNQAGSQVECAHVSDVNRNGQPSDFSHTDSQGTVWQLEGSQRGSRSAGVSRGTTGLEVHTYVSRRIKYIEPYGGLRALFEFPNDSSDFEYTNFRGSAVNHLPIEGWITLGVQFIPWENREKFNRLSFDTRAEFAYRSEGRDYSPLFDALGSSDALSLRRPNYSSYQVNPNGATKDNHPSEVNPNSEKAYMTGLGDVQAFAKFKGSGSVTWQAGEFVKFQFGVGYMYEQGHLLTMDQPCNSSSGGTVQVSEAGPCRSSRPNAQGGTTFTPTGLPNPNYRPAVNLVGKRFKYDDIGLVDLWINGIVMF